MKANQKIAAIIICLLVFISTFLVSAEEIPYRYSTINAFSCTLTISSGTATCRSYLTVTSSSNTPSLIVTLRRSSDGQTWSKVDSWSTTGSGTIGAAIDKSIVVSQGYQYKLSAIGTVKNSSGTVLENVSTSSKIVSY